MSSLPHSLAVSSSFFLFLSFCLSVSMNGVYLYLCLLFVILLCLSLGVSFSIFLSCTVCPSLHVSFSISPSYADNPSLSFDGCSRISLSLSLSLSLSVGHDSSFSNCKEIGNLSPQGKAIKVSRPPHYYFSAIFNQSEWDMSIISIPLSLPLSLALSLGDVIKDLIFWEGNESLKLMKVQNIILR